jgi:hypothetical protein
MIFKIPTTLRIVFAATGYLACTTVGSAAPSATKPYTLSVFAVSANGYSQPDSIVQWKNSIIIGFQNHVAKDGSDGKSSTVVQFSLDGKPERTFSVKGHNDGLRIIGRHNLWCLQNEDANPNLVVIDLNTGTQKTYTFAPTPHGGGYDDMVVVDDRVYITASNPSGTTNIFPALVRATLSGSMVVTEPVLYGNASAIDIPTGTTVTLNLSDPDSLTVDPRGNIVLDSQADGELVFVRNVESSQKLVGRLPLTAPSIPIDPTIGPFTIDDTAFAPNSGAFMLVTDVGGDVIYRIGSAQFGFEPGTAYSASDTYGIVGSLNLDTGLVTPIVTGLVSGRGLIFVVPPNEEDGE